MKKLLSFLLLTTSALLAYESGVNILSTHQFSPVIMHGKPTAAYGWYLQDSPRGTYSSAKGQYLSGEDCFALSFQDNAITFTFPTPLCEAYTLYGDSLLLKSRIGFPNPPAAKYHIKAQLKFTQGKASFLNSDFPLKPAPDWQSLDFFSENPVIGFAFKPVAGTSYSFKHIEVIPVYEKLGTSIPLPNGGSLQKILIEKNADYITRWATALWQGWLWKLTGIALPVEEVTPPTSPVKNAFVVLHDNSIAKGDWNLDVTANGIVLTCSENRVIPSALFDYLRLGLKCGFYCEKVIKLPENVRELAAINRKARPKFKYLIGDASWNCMNGGLHLPLLYANNDVDYYHLHNPQNDHVMNVMLPMEIYFKDHPEYFMMDKHGNRVVNASPTLTNPCISNKEAMSIIVKNAVDYAKYQSVATNLNINVADAATQCQCPACKALNQSEKSCSDSVMHMVNEIASGLKKANSDKTIEFCSYTTRRHLPTHIFPKYDNITLTYTLSHDVIPCTLHVDCDANKKGLAILKQWYDLLGKDASKLGLYTYRDIRPLHNIRQMEYLSQYANQWLYMFVWRAWNPSAPFITARWNLGEDVNVLLEEYDNACYGKGGPFVHQVNLLVDQYAQNYKHTPEELNHKGLNHLCIWGGDPESKTLLDRPTLDKIYELFAQAEKATQNDLPALKRILKEKSLYLVEDLMKYNLFSCKDSQGIQGFTSRLCMFIRDAKIAPQELNTPIHNVGGRQLLAATAGIQLPWTQNYWANEPALDKILQDPSKAFVTASKPIPGGFYFTPFSLQSKKTPMVYSYQCPARAQQSLSRPSIGYSQATLTFNLPQKPRYPLFLSVEGLDDDKPGVSTLKIDINGKTIFSGPNAFREHEWSRMGFMLPADALQQGDNTLLLANTTPDTPSRSAIFGDDPESKNDSQWGWLGISEIYILDPNNDFVNFANGSNPKGNWAPYRDDADKITGTVVAKNGKVTLTSPQKGTARIAFWKSHESPKLTVTPGHKVQISVTASGKGTLEIAMPGYSQYKTNPLGKQVVQSSGYLWHIGHRGTFSKKFQLTDSPQTFTLNAKTINDPNLAKAWGNFFPYISLLGEGNATLTHLQIEIF